MPAASYRYAARRFCRRATPATLTGVNGRPTRAWALSIDSEMPPCSDQPKDNNAAHVKAEAARAVFRARFMGFLRCAKDLNACPRSRLRRFSGNVDNVHVAAVLGIGGSAPAPPLLQRVTSRNTRQLWLRKET